MGIVINKSPTADTRTCDWSKVTEEELLRASRQHIADVGHGMRLLAEKLVQAADNHDHTKISGATEFHADFKSGFSQTAWWVAHQREERHHFNTPELIQDDVNLIDVLEQIVDGVMAGMARSGKYRREPVSSELLQKAYANTAKLLLENVVVSDNMPDGFSRGYSDCTQDAAENTPLSSIGKDRNSAPERIPECQRAGWLKGYAHRAAEMYGSSWKTAQFGWAPVMTIDGTHETA